MDFIYKYRQKYIYFILFSLLNIKCHDGKDQICLALCAVSRSVTQSLSKHLLTDFMSI